MKDNKLIKENEIMGKILIEIILHNDDISDERITRLFAQEDWKERVGFKVYDDGDIGWKKQLSWLSKPHKIFRNLKKKKEELVKENLDYQKKTKEQALKIDKLEKELKEKELMIKNLESKVEEGKEESDCHFKAIKACEDWYTKNPGCIKEQLNDKVELLQKADEKLLEKETEIQRLEEEDERKTQMLIKADEKAIEKDRRIEELERQLSLNNKPLPKTPSKFKVFKEKSKTKFQHSIEKIKHQSREFISRIEVKVK